MSDHSSLRRLATRGILGSSRRIYSHQTLQSGRSGQLRERPMAEPVPIDEKFDFSVERSKFLEGHPHSEMERIGSGF